jgi:hypothetical protein
MEWQRFFVAAGVAGSTRLPERRESFMPTRLLFALSLCLISAPRSMAKPPDLPQQTHPDLTPGEPEIFFIPLMEPFAPLTTPKVGEEEQETKPAKAAESGWPFACHLCGLLSGPYSPWLWMKTLDERKPIEDQQVFGNYDVLDLVQETTGNNVRRGPSQEKRGATLVREIEKHIRPGSWESQGGVAGIEYNAETHSLAIRADEETQQQVSDLLSEMRFKQEQIIRTKHENMAQPGAEEASSENASAQLFAQAMVAMGHDITDLLEGQDADEVVRNLVRVIETTIAPKTWVNRGGSGQLHYNPELKTFFIVQTEDVQEAIREIINLKRSEKTVDKPTPPEPVFDFFMGDVGLLGRSGASTKEWHDWHISDLLEKAHRNLLAGRVHDAQLQVREALAYDRKAVLANPLVYKMQLLHQVLNESRPVGNEDSNDQPRPTLSEKQQAAKDLKIADFYRRRGKDDAAWFCYRLVQRRYPGQEEAKEATKRIEELSARLQRQGKPLPSDSQKPERLVPHMPDVDPGVVHAYHEILEQAPKKTPTEIPAEAREVKPAVLEVEDEACELELVPAVSPGKPSLCFDRDGQRRRIQLQFGPLTLKLLDEGKGKSSLTIDWNIVGPTH